MGRAKGEIWTTGEISHQVFASCHTCKCYNTQCPYFSNLYLHNCKPSMYRHTCLKDTAIYMYTTNFQTCMDHIFRDSCLSVKLKSTADIFLAQKICRHCTPRATALQNRISACKERAGQLHNTQLQASETIPAFRQLIPASNRTYFLPPEDMHQALQPAGMKLEGTASRRGSRKTNGQKQIRTRREFQSTMLGPR